MNTHAPKNRKKNNQTNANGVYQKQIKNTPVSLFTDNRPEAIVQRKLFDKANNNPKAQKTVQLIALTNNVSTKQIPIQRKGNNSGLPNTLKSGIEHLSGMDMGDIKVHYNSPKPAQLQAHAYTQGSNIHVAPGQEKHLPHEAWHAVQQKQGRVKPTTQLKGNVNINDNLGLEKEADVMGTKAVNTKQFKMPELGKVPTPNNIVQRSGIGFPINGKVEDEMAFQLKKDPVQRVEIPLGRGSINTNRKADIGRVHGYLRRLYQSGQHGAIMDLRAQIEHTNEPYQRMWLGNIDKMMQYAGLNAFVRNVATRSGAQNFAQGYVRVFTGDGEIAVAHRSAAKGSGEAAEHGKSRSRWKTVGGASDRKISKRDAEAQVCDQLWEQFRDEEVVPAAKIEIHIVTYNGPCDSCKSRIAELALDLKTHFGGEVPVFIRIYYITPPRHQTRGRRDTRTSYGWGGDRRDDERGLFTHDDEA